MRIPRSLVIFFCAAGAALALATVKALAVSGLDTLPRAKVLVFAASTFGLIAALLDWALLRGILASPRAEPDGAKRRTMAPAEDAPAETAPAKARTERTENAKGPAPRTDPIVERARLRAIVFREICPPPETAGLSFYGGLPVGPAALAWPRVRNKPGDAPLSFIMQWDCGELARQDVTGLLPRDGVLYLFCDLNWGDPFDFQFVHAPGPVDGWQALPAPPGLPAVYGGDGAYHVPYCSPQIAKERQDVPRLLPKWLFTPIAFAYPAAPIQLGRDPDAGRGEVREGLFWDDGEAAGEALLQVQHPEGAPPATRRDEPQTLPFRRPFPAFPHDHASVRVVAAKVLDQLRRPSSRLLREASEDEREARFQVWREAAAQRYASAAAHRPAARVEPSLSDEIWHWMEELEPLLTPGWGSIVQECVNVSLGLGSEGAGALPADLVAGCAERHKLASAYLRDESPDWSKPEARAMGEARKAEGSLKEVRSVHAACPNHMFGPPSFVQGHVEEYLEEWVLLLELSSREPVGLTFGEGVLQFMIRPADLRERRFDRVVLVASAY